MNLQMLSINGTQEKELKCSIKRDLEISVESNGSVGRLWRDLVTPVMGRQGVCPALLM